MTTYKIVQDQIAQSQIVEAINTLATWAHHTKTHIFAKELVAIQSQYNSLKRDIRLGLLKYDESSREFSKISNTLLEILDIYLGAPMVVVQTTTNNITYNFIIGGTNYQDPENFKKFLEKERHGVPVEYSEGISFGKSVLGYARSKFDDRTYETEFAKLRYAVQDLEERKNLTNLKSVINEVTKYQNDILDLLKAEAKESLLQKLYNDANECHERTFPDVYELFLKKYMEVKCPNDVATLNSWYYERNEFFTNIAGKSNLFLKASINTLRNNWLDKFKP